MTLSCSARRALGRTIWVTDLFSDFEFETAPSRGPFFIRNNHLAMAVGSSFMALLQGAISAVP
jgi:hypothetical protein